MKRIITTAVLTSFITVASFAQMQFSKTTHDFGQVPEAEGEVTYDFVFTNAGKSPIIITDVKSSCGCTTPEWPKQPILPGKTGTVKAIFDPKDRPGIFDKEITVSTRSEQVKLRIIGTVIPRTKGVVDLYPRTIGSLRLKSNNIPFANIYNTATAVDSLPIINNGNSPLTLAFEDVPSHITIKAQPSVLKPGERGVIVCTYYAHKKNDYGYVADKLKLTINGNNVKGNELIVSATIDEDFSLLSATQKANAPVFQVESRSIALGAVKAGENKEFSISITNNGKSDLIIRKATSNCDCITLSNGNPKTVKAGQTAELKASFNSTGLKGNIYKNITLITNAPALPKTTIRVSASVN